MMHYRVSVRQITSLGSRQFKTQITQMADQVVQRKAYQVMMEARKSIRIMRGKTAKRNPAKPGTPPHSISQGNPIRLIKYARLKPGTFVVGTEKLPRTDGTPVPGLHEHGGTKVITVRASAKRAGGKRGFASEAQRRGFYEMIKRQRKSAARKPLRTKRMSVRFPRRPFMRPALFKAARIRS